MAKPSSRGRPPVGQDKKEKKDRGMRPSERASRKKKSQRVIVEHTKEFKAIPKSIIITRGKLDQSFRQLMNDFRVMFEPYSSKSLTAVKRNHIKDFIDVAQIFAATHLQIFSHTLSHAFWKVGVLPKGPQCVFSVINYSLAKDIRKVVTSEQGITLNLHSIYTKPAVCILNGFGKLADTNPKVKVAQSLLLNLFPKVDYNESKLSDIRRVVYFSIDAETEVVSMRHYLVKRNVDDEGPSATIGIKLAEIGPSMDMKIYEITETIQITPDRRPKIADRVSKLSTI
eukprot:GHVH01011803.1.p1 GENE.GHVH01011803.1~~GHVH01011803.1.p1  ORF type:complete len:299 (-),score=40.38 GHVH01011803.1:22-873(-)